MTENHVNLISEKLPGVNINQNNLGGITMLLFLFGFVVGVLSFSFGVTQMIAGNLRVDHSDPGENPYLFLELSKNLEFLRKRKYVVLKVRFKDFLPHE